MLRPLPMTAAGISFHRLGASDVRFAWELNQSHVPHVGSTAYPEFERLCTISACALVALLDGSRAGFLLGMTRDADYACPNFLWFRGRYATFLYVDRIAVSTEHHQRGVGAALYRETEAEARKQGLPRLCCEVNLRPPNPGSMAFHQRLGFTQVGAQEL